MSEHRIYKIPFSKIHSLYVQKAERKNRTKKEGHVAQIGTGQDQQSQRNRGAGARTKS